MMIRKENIVTTKHFTAKYYRIFAENHFFPWVRDVIDRYKARGIYPNLKTDIAHYYTDPKDKEVALFASMVLSNNANVARQVRDMRTIMGDHPFEWFSNREYIFLSTGNSLLRKVDGNSYCKYWKIAKHMDRASKFINAPYYSAQELGSLVDGDLGVKDYDVRLASMALMTNDGIGCGLRNGYSSKILCPVSKDLEKFARTWFCNDRYYLFSFDDIVELFDLQHHSDFFYFYLAWNELCKLKPKECSRCLTLYQRWCASGDVVKARRWRGLLPVVEF